MAICLRVGIRGSVGQVGEQVVLVVVRAEAAFLLLEAVHLQRTQQNTVL